MFPFTIKSLLPTELTAVNYIAIFTEYDFWRPIVNTLIVTILTILLGCVINSMAGFAFTCFEFKGKKIFYPLVLVSFMVPFEAIAIPLYSVADTFGMVDTYAGMIIPAIADGLVTFLFIQFFKDIPPSLIEAARVDGAKWPVIFRNRNRHYNFCSCIHYSRIDDIYESVEFIFMAVTGSALQRNKNYTDCH